MFGRQYLLLKHWFNLNHYNLKLPPPRIAFSSKSDLHYLIKKFKHFSLTDKSLPLNSNDSKSSHILDTFTRNVVAHSFEFKYVSL